MNAGSYSGSPAGNNKRGRAGEHTNGGGGGSNKRAASGSSSRTGGKLDLLTRYDLTSDLTGELLKLLWPDDNSWWDGEVISMDMDTLKAVILYATTQEEEEVDMAEMVSKQEVAWAEEMVTKPTRTSTPKSKPRAAAPAPPTARSQPAEHSLHHAPGHSMPDHARAFKLKTEPGVQEQNAALAYNGMPTQYP
eukprot:CAMPEP_0119114960 /NCGR_PEP_ID=MMETSP1180-20130426/49313_1 /TAXON_ID=3052 ORGANISM="Chlamydomonas cf sp, Strain CCMP681" /NCGR_SAMPLE_ID=MMETSP1180 /ASSEMBLY_ACC=CAM_ASM_000741 /LENGTH=191 /DNA_ID=CAMNT_0007103725 /DNA_START=9 /DNA_END=580 /DNA_ORIENTATION=+